MPVYVISENACWTLLFYNNNKKIWVIFTCHVKFYAAELLSKSASNIVPYLGDGVGVGGRAGGRVRVGLGVV